MQTLDLHWNSAAADPLSGLLGKFNMLFIVKTLFSLRIGGLTGGATGTLQKVIDTIDR